jgi:tetratricopeptide (TPR) repeat protein
MALHDRPPVTTVPQGRITDHRVGSSGVVWWMLAVLGLANVLAWSNALDGAFVLDDVVHIVEDQKRLVEWWPLSESLRFEQRPLTFLTLVADHARSVADPRGYHLTNVVLHLLAAAALFLAMREIARRLEAPGADWIAFATALLWSLHPLQTAAATYVIQRAEILLAIGGFTAAWCLLRSMREGAGLAWRIATPIAVAFAMLSKPTALVLPPILIALDWMVSGDRLGALLRRRGLVHAANVATWLLLIPLGVLPGLVETSDGPTGVGLGVAGTTPWEYARMQVAAVGLYTTLAIWPAGLSIDHGRSALESTGLDLLGWIVIAAAALSALLGLVRRRWWGLPGAILLIGLAPTSSIVPLADPAADHRMYLPLVAFAVLVASAGVVLVEFLARAMPVRRLAIRGAGLLVLAGLAVAEGVRTRDRNLDYVQPERLWSEVLERRPDDRRARLNRSHALIASGRPEEARGDLEILLAASSADVLAGLNLALLELERGNAASVMPLLDRAVEANPRLPVARSARGDALMMLGRPGAALADYEVAARRQPSNPLVRLAIGNALAELDRLDEAAATFEIAADLAERAGDPALAASAHFNAGNMHFIAERYDLAVRSYEAALRRNPEHPEAARWRDEARTFASGEPGEAGASP